MRKSRRVVLVSVAALALATGCAKKNNDAQLATNIKAQMFSDPQTRDAGLQVAVKNGVVTLTGTVPDNGARYEAYKLATTTPGVTKVNDQMVVQAPEQTAQVTPPVTPAPQEMPAHASVPARDRARERRKAEAARRARLAEEQKRRDAVRREQQKQSHAALREMAPPQDAAQAPAPAPATDVTPPPPSPPPPPPQPVTAIFPAGTTVEIQTVDPVDSSVNHEGDEFQATLAQPLTWNGRVVVPAGTDIYLRLVSATRAGHYKGRTELNLQLVRLEFQGTQYPLVSTTYTVAGGSRGKNTAEKVGGVAALGAIIGAIAGGGKGAAIGAGVGAAGGGVYQGETKAKKVRIAPETKLDFKLDQPLNVTYMPAHHSR
ncbi:MAG TPA: BON domain-containing protein [Candidatus Acidoferrales bacterium]|nr:BON domain-containing protein [Candidatus Acidoferrales bacterium]